MLKTLLPLWLLFRVLVLPRKSRKRREVRDLGINSGSVNRTQCGHRALAFTWTQRMQGTNDFKTDY